MLLGVGNAVAIGALCVVMRAGVLLCVLNSEQPEVGCFKSPSEREPHAWGFWFVPHSNMNVHMHAYLPLMASAPISDRGGL